MKKSLLENNSLLKGWQTFGMASGLAASIIRLAIYALLLFLAFECTTIDLRWPEQAVLGGLTIALTLAIHFISDSELITLARMFASMLATARYAYWRFSTVFHAFADRQHPIYWLDVFLC